MTRDELMQIGHDAGFDTSELTGEVIALLECVAEHAEAKESAARIEAQQRLADMQELAAKAGLAHRMAVQRCVQAAVAEAVAAEREACEERVVSLFEVLETPYLPDITRAIRARGTA